MRKLLLLLLTFMVLGGCRGGSQDNRSLAYITVLPAENRMAIGGELQFTATGTYDDNTTQDLTAAAVWKSSDPAVVAVASGGKGTAAAAGNATITAAVGDVAGTTTISVVPRHLVSITVTPQPARIAVGTTATFSAVGTFSDNVTEDLTSAATWTVSAPSVAAVSAAGTITGIAAGETTLIATLQGVSGKAPLTVTSATLASLAVTPANPAIGLGTRQKVHAIGTFSDNSQQDLGPQVSWTSSDVSVATISPDGTIAAVAAGVADITASVYLGNSFTATTVLTVTSAKLQQLLITPENPNAPAGAVRQFTATGLLLDNTTQDLTSYVTWTSSDPSVAAMAPDGRCTAISAGTATVGATYDTMTASTVFQVIPAQFTGTWTGTYTIYDDPARPQEVGSTYSYQFDLDQKGDAVTGTAWLRGTATGEFRGTVTGNRLEFEFQYYSPFFKATEYDRGTAVLVDGVLSGNVIENHRSGYNTMYRFSLQQ